MTAPDAALLVQVRAILSQRDQGGTPAEVADALTSGPTTGRHRGWHAAADVLRTSHSLGDELTGLGPLEALARQDGVTDILVNGPREVWADRGAGLDREDLDLGSEVEVRALAVRLAAVSGRRLDDASPCVDARLPGGVRLHAVLPPVAVSGTAISLRIPSRAFLQLAELVAGGCVPATWCEVLRALVRARVGFLVSGGTGTGKTTVLGALLAEAAPADRLVIIEDTAELEPAVAHRMSIQARRSNAEGAGAVAMSELVRQALRMRPDRIVVGECRGAEVTDLLTALNTGHSGCGTVHANSAVDVPARLEALGLLAGVPRLALQRQLASGLAAVVHLQRDARGVRRLTTIGVVSDSVDGVRVVPALAHQASTTTVGEGWPQLARLIGWTGDPP